MSSHQHNHKPTKGGLSRTTQSSNMQVTDAERHQWLKPSTVDDTYAPFKSGTDNTGYPKSGKY